MRVQDVTKGQSARTTAGATLVELLVAIGVIGVLISILVPVLAQVRARGGEAVSLGRARDAASAIRQYAGSNDGRYPVAEAGVVYPVSMDGSVGMTLSEGPPWPGWASAHLWPAVIDPVVPWAENAQAYKSPGSEPVGATGTMHPPSYRYSNSFVAQPWLWSESEHSSERMQRALAPVRLADVAHPSGKVLLWDNTLAYLRERKPSFMGLPGDPTPMAFADGHAAVHLASEATAAVPNPHPLNDGSQSRAPIHNTPMGVLGRDF